MTNKRAYVLEHDHDYPLRRQRWIAANDDDEGLWVAEKYGHDIGMSDLVLEFSKYLAKRHQDAERLRITVEEVE